MITPCIWHKILCTRWWLLLFESHLHVQTSVGSMILLSAVLVISGGRSAGQRCAYQVWIRTKFKAFREPHLTVCYGQYYFQQLSWTLGRYIQCKPTGVLLSGYTDFHHTYPGWEMENSLQVPYCVHGKDGYLWKGELENMKNHFHSQRGCDYASSTSPTNKWLFIAFLSPAVLQKGVVKFSRFV